MLFFVKLGSSALEVEHLLDKFLEVLNATKIVFEFKCPAEALLL